MRYCLSHGECLENHCKDRKWCFHLGVTCECSLAPTYGPSSPLFSRGFLPFDAPHWFVFALFAGVALFLCSSVTQLHSLAVLASHTFQVSTSRANVED